MKSDSPEFLITFGEYQGKHSFVFQCKTKKALVYGNLPPELESILRRIYAEDIEDIELGGGGRWYIRYLPSGKSYRRYSSGLLPEIGKAGSAEHVALGAENRHWAVKVATNGRCHASLSMGPYDAESKFVTAVAQGGPHYRDVRFATLGCDGNYCVNVKGALTFSTKCKPLKKALDAKAKTGREIVHVALSPIDPKVYFITYADGAYGCILPREVQKAVSHLLPKQRARTEGGEEQTSPLQEVSPVTQATEYQHGESFVNTFAKYWLHPHKRHPRIQRIVSVKQDDKLEASYQSYRKNLEIMTGLPFGGECNLFHGTRRLCQLGNSSDDMTPCEDTNCNLCRIVEDSFKLNRAGTSPGRAYMRFGPGIYTTMVSSKADDYTGKEQGGLRAMIFARVALGSVSHQHYSLPHITAPPPGYHSIWAHTGRDLNYSESVVYHEDAIRPAYLVIYRL